MKTIQINPTKIPFSLKVREMCTSCKRYNTKATCPPYVENINYYKELFNSYKNGIVCYEKFECKDKNNWIEIGKHSSLVISNYLLKRREELFKEGHYFISVFGAGSCKLCPTCSFPCRHPQKAIIPLEATGVDVVQLMKNCLIDIKFPIKDVFYRIGLILYD